MSLRSAINEFNAQSASMKAMFSALSEIEKHYEQSDQLVDLTAQLEQVRSDLASERDMLASTSNDLTEELAKVEALRREAGGILAAAEAEIQEKRIQVKAECDTLVREAGIEARRKQQVAEQSLDGITQEIGRAKEALEGMLGEIAHNKGMLEQQVIEIAANDERLTKFNEAFQKL